MDALENQLKEARFLAEEADRKYDEVIAAWRQCPLGIKTIIIIMINRVSRSSSSSSISSSPSHLLTACVDVQPASGSVCRPRPVDTANVPLVCVFSMASEGLGLAQDCLATTAFFSRLPRLIFLLFSTITLSSLVTTLRSLSKNLSTLTNFSNFLIFQRNIDAK